MIFIPLCNSQNNIFPDRSFGLWLRSNVLPDPVHVDAVRPLDGQPESPGPHAIGEAANRPGDCEHHCVISVLDHSEVLQAGATVGVDVGEGILNLTDLPEDARNSLEADLHQLRDFVVLDVPLGKTLQMDESRIGLPEDSVPVAWHHSAFLQGLMDILLNDFLTGSSPIVEFLNYANRYLEVDEPFQALLVGQPVKGPSQSVDSRR